MVGPPGSGKTHLAKQMPAVRVNQDEEGKGHMSSFYNALLAGEDIVVDRMNFDAKQRARYIGPAREREYEIEIVLLYMPHEICLFNCKFRTGHPTIVSEDGAKKALNHFFRAFQYPTPDEGLIVSKRFEAPKKMDAIIVDLDGTLADCEHRRHFVHPPEGEKKDWLSFFKGCGEDAVVAPIHHLILAMQDHCEVVLCSGRPEDHCRELTESWLVNNLGATFPLFMRPAGDSRQDSLVKEIILDFELLPRYNILFTVDDRKQVVDMWRRRGLTCLQCAEGNF